MESFELASGGCHLGVLLLFRSLACSGEDSPVLVGHLHLLFTVSGPILALFILVVRLLLYLVSLFSHVSVARRLAHDVTFHSHCSLLLLLGNLVHV